MRSMDMQASTTTETVAEDQDEAYLAQRQSTMDSATLDKLLMAEKNLAQAGQATTNVWKLIGKLPSEESESPPSNAQATGLSASVSMPLRQNSRSTTNFSASQGVSSSPRHTRTSTRRKISTQASDDMAASRYMSAGAHSPPNGNQWAATAPSGSRGELVIDTVDTANIEARSSPRYNMEIPRPDVSVGRSSLGSYASTQSNSFYERPAYAGVGARAMDTLSDSNNFLVENGRSRSTHSSNVFGFNRNAAPLSEVTLFTFTVKKSDSVLEKLGSKRASIQLQVDVDERMLYFLSAHDQREEYSCAAVTAKPQSRLGMQLKIQTNNASVNKKITFYSTEDRANFVQALEQGKVMVNKKTATAPTPSRPSRTTTEIIDETASTVSSTFERSKLRDSMVNDHFQLLPGESVLEHVQRVTNLVVMSQSDRAVQGVLKITSYRITFVPYDASWKFGSFELPLAAIDLITRDGLMLLISCKDLRTLRLAMHDAYSRKKGYDQLPSTPDFRWLNLLTLRMKPPNMIGALFAFDYHTEKAKQRGAPLHEKHNGWFVYSPFAEYQRLGFLSAKKHQEEEGVITWRLLKNSKFRFSPTYPQLMVVPSLMSEEQLVQSARFRSRARLPVVVWRHPVNKSVLSRSSQPNYGMAGNRSEPDRILLRAYRDSANKNSSNMSPPLHIIDARKPIATKGNRLKGKGVENSQHYDNATIEFMGIANIHKMRESLDALKSLVSPSSVEDGDKHYHNRLENTRWLKHVMRVLSGARRVAEVLHEDGASVLVHCSDGWDRTPQLVALAQLILDPFYRSIRGFASLVEKEWCSFGHKFADRIGVGKDITDQPNERSPVMLQFLDCVWQMTRQFPTCFEFNEKFLLHISDSLISGLYGTFLYNSERERVLDKVWERTESVWTPVLENPGPYKNPLYRPTNRVLYPRANLKRVVLWDGMFFRWDPESHPDYMEYMDPVEKGDDDASTHDFDEDESPRGASVLDSPSVMPIGGDLEDKAELDIDVIHDYDEFRTKTLSDCSDMSDDEDFEISSSVTARYDGSSTLTPDELNMTTPATSDSENSENRIPMDGGLLGRYQRGAEERTRQRAQGRNIREALLLAPDQSRIKYLEQLLSESVARELQLEAELDSVLHRAVRGGISTSNGNANGAGTSENVAGEMSGEEQLMAAMGFTCFGRPRTRQKKTEKIHELPQLMPGTELVGKCAQFIDSVEPGRHGVVYLLCKGDENIKEDNGEDSTPYASLLEELEQEKQKFELLDNSQFLRARNAANAFETLGRHRFLNRSAMKLVVLDHIFEWTQRSGDFSFTDICGGPGGFSEYLLWRIGNVEDVRCVRGYGITLKGAVDNCDWRLSSDFRDVFTICYGQDGTGNLYSTANIRNFSDLVCSQHPNGVDLAVADGGFLEARAQSNQTSRPASSERYLVMRGLRADNPTAALVKTLEDQLTQSNSDTNYQFCFLENSKLMREDVDFLQYMKEVNKAITRSQIQACRHINEYAANGRKRKICEDTVDSKEYYQCWQLGEIPRRETSQ
ncbi:Myotubularin [Phytophthora citrophthora]|uniref:Myotubularin n=1 Tax=Phytophthora citrophthora TaxID=4793 RepID=A0AAD9LFV0_9STRA|nr:Myotubularin [Phytophthora citrophthora]